MKFIIIFILSYCNPMTDTYFIDKLTDDFGRYSLYISIKTEDNTKYIIENDDLFFCLKNQNSLDKKQYQEYVKDNLTYGKSFKIINLNSNFIKVYNVPSVEAQAQKGIDKFIKKYFDNGKTLKDNISDREKVAIIQKLFEWKIACKIDCETGYLVISK